MRALRRLSALRARVAAALLGVAADDAVVAGAPPVAVREIFRRFWPWARPYRRWLWLTLVFVVLGPLVDTAVIWLFKEVVDRVLVPHDFGPFWWIALAYLGLTLLSGLVGVADRILSTWVGERFLADLRVALFEHLQRLSLEFFERRPLGDVLARLGGDVGAIEDFVLSGVADALSYTLNLAFFAGALFYLRWELALVSLAVAPLFFLAARTFSERIKHAARERRRRSGSINAVAEEALANAALVQAYNRQATETARFREQAMGSFRAQLASARIRALFTPVVDVIELVGAMLVIALGTWELTQGRISLGGLLAFLAYLTRMYGPIRGLSRLSNQIFAASASAERVIELLDERPRIVDRPGARPAGRARELAFEEVGFRYPGAGSDALFGLSFRVGPGETLALVGASGAGKSTVAKLALRFYEPDRGRILLDGADVAGLTVASVRENLAVVLQETLVFDATVAENIAYGRPGASEREIREAARAADAEEFILALPEGYRTRVGQRGRRLSGGQRQRLAIARAMLRDAPVLVLDEPTTGLDRASAERVLEPLRRLREGRAAIVISHDLLTVREATEIVVLAAGAVVERGTHEELLRAGGAYARLSSLAHPPAPAPAAP